MPHMTIRITNSAFVSSNGGEYENVDGAFDAAIIAGLEIAAAEVRGGCAGTIVEVAVDLVGQREAARGAIAISMVRFHPARPAPHQA